MLLLKKFLMLIFLFALFPGCEAGYHKKLRNIGESIEKEEYKAALDEISKVLEPKEKTAEYDFLKGRVLFYNGFLIQAEKLFQETLTLLASNQSENIQKILLKSELYYYQGMVLRKLLKQEESIGWLEKSLNLLDRLENNPESRPNSDELSKTRHLRASIIKEILFCNNEINLVEGSENYLNRLLAIDKKNEVYRAVLHHVNGEYQQAISVFEDQADWHKNRKIIEQINLGLIYGDSLLKLEKFAECERVLNEVINSAEKINTPIEKKDALLAQAFLYQEKADFDKAALKIKEAFDILGEPIGRQSIQKDMVYAVYYFFAGDYEKARQSFKAVATHQNANKKYLSSVYGFMGIIALKEAKYYEAITALNQSLKNNPTKGEGLNAASIYNNLGICYLNLNLDEKAAGYLAQSIKIIDNEISKNKDKPQALKELAGFRILNTAGIAYKKKNSRLLFSLLSNLKAYSQDNKKLNAYYALLAAKSLFIKTSVDNSDYAKALDLFQSAVDFFYLEQNYGKLGEVYFNIGKLNFVLKDYEKSKLAFETSCRNYEKSVDKKGHALCYYGTAAAKASLNDLKGAASDLGKSLDLLEEVESQFNFKELSSEFFNANYGPYELMIDLQLRLKDYEKAFYYLEKSKAKTFIKMIYQGMADIEKEIPEEIRQRINQIYRQNSELNLKVLESAPGLREKYIARIQNNENILKELKVEINLKCPKIKEIIYPESVSVKTLQESLKEGEAVLSYYLYRNEKTVVFLIGKDDFKVFETLTLSGTWKLVKDFRANMKAIMSEYQYNRFNVDTDFYTLSGLYENLFEKVHPEAKKYQRLIIIPDQELYYLPFEALTFKEKGKRKYLLEEAFVISYIHSASILKLLRSRPTPENKKTLFAIGNPTLKHGAPLLHAKPELLAAHEFLGGALITGPEATKKRFLSAKLHDYDYIHISTHGYFDKADYSKQALMFAGQENDAFVTLEEIYQLKLNSKLVCLSACETGMGKEIKGEGLFGLTQSFLYAGSQSVTVTLWPVFNMSTAAMMMDFYKKIAAKKNIPLALKEAKLNILRKRFNHDYFLNPKGLSEAEKKKLRAIGHFADQFISHWSNVYFWSPMIYFGL